MKTILLLDDEPAVLKITALILRGATGWRVVEAATLQAAADHAKSSIDLVIADVCIDGQAPSAVADHLRILCPHVPVLFISGYPRETLLGNGLLEDGAAFLAKPFSPATLLRRIREVLEADTAAPHALRAAG
ncbi:MAG: response regulator [Acidobacteriia bacterium]|nr:response regulator [Terriglobia bacterium]